MWPEGAQSLTEITKRPATVGTRFKNSMIGLVQNLSTKDPFYVRCIKPNENKVPNTFDNDKVKTQVFYLGLLENVRVRRAGFAYRMTYESFLKRYKCLSKKTWPMPKSSQEPKDSTSDILNELSLEADVRYGVTKVFIRSPETVFHLEKKRSDRIPEIVIYIQKVLLSLSDFTWLTRFSKYFQILKFWRGTLARNYVQRLRATNRIARSFRAYKLRTFVKHLQYAYE